MRGFVFAGALLAVCAVPGAASAATGVLVLPLEDGGLPASTAKALDAAVRAEVRASLPKSKLLPPPALSLSDLQIAAGCVDASPACLAGIGRTLRAGRVVRVVGRGSAEQWTLRVLSVNTKTARASSHEAVLAGVDEDSAAELRWHVATALGSEPAPLTGRIELYTASKVGSLAGAELLLDDARVPAGRLAKVSPGRHRVEVRQKGFETFIWLGQVRGGRTTRVAVRFDPKQSPPAPPPVVETPPIAAAPAAPGSSPRAAPVEEVKPIPPESPTLVYTWVFGAGAVAAATAATVLGLQTKGVERDVEAQRLACEGDNPVDKDSDLCRRGQRLEKVQFAVWAGAVALAGAAVAAFFLEDGPAIVSGNGNVTVGVAPQPGGAAAALRVNF